MILAVQVVVSELLEKWGRSGFETHIKDIQRQYARRAGIVHAAAKKHLVGPPSLRHSSYNPTELAVVIKLVQVSMVKLK